MFFALHADAAANISYQDNPCRDRPGVIQGQGDARCAARTGCFSDSVQQAVLVVNQARGSRQSRNQQ